MVRLSPDCLTTFIGLVGFVGVALGVPAPRRPVVSANERGGSRSGLPIAALRALRCFTVSVSPGDAGFDLTGTGDALRTTGFGVETTPPEELRRLSLLLFDIVKPFPIAFKLLIPLALRQQAPPLLRLGASHVIEPP